MKFRHSIGEHPGLSSPDSLGICLTYGQRPRLTDAERNCISNIRPAGLDYANAARKLAYLIDGASRLGCSGVAFKDSSDKEMLTIETQLSMSPAIYPFSVERPLG